MVKNIKILDCTLRDGGRLFNCEFSNEMIKDMSEMLQKAHIDIIEVGFLRDPNTINYIGNSTFFNTVRQISDFIPCKEERKALFVAFIDYGMFDFSTLDNYDGTSVDGIRFGFTHKNFIEHREDVVNCMKIVKDKGYKLFVQSVNTLGYTDAELLDVVETMNEIMPYSYGIVDTYGAMYEEELRHYFYMIDKNLSEDIHIDFHSHNNYQMSFALAQKVIKMSEANGRMIIIDATLNGMGKGAGNLNLELITDYLVRKRNYNYDEDIILDIIDKYLKEIKKNNSWGYSLPSLFSGIYKCHPNNMIYLTEKFDLASKDIKAILSAIEPETRERYDYDNLQRVCEEYSHTKIEDFEIIEKIRKEIFGKDILLVMPGPSLNKYKEVIAKYVHTNNPIVFSVNFVYTTEEVVSEWVFFGSADRYRSFRKEAEGKQVVFTSNIKGNKNDNIVNYEGLVERGNINFDNSAIMCLNMLRKCDVRSITLAGFDGYSDSLKNYYEDKNIQSDLILGKSIQMNKDIQDMFSRFCKSIAGEISMKFITPSKYKVPIT